MSGQRKDVKVQRCGVLSVALLCWLATSSLAAEPQVREAELKRVEVIERVAPTVVAVFAKGGAGGGSGVLISKDGFALTNFHVVSGLGPFMKCGLNDGVLYDAVLVGIDPTGDVALIKLLGREDFPVATLGDSDKLEIGDWTYVMGNPFLLATDFQPTVTYGIISGTHRYQPPSGTWLEYTDCIQVDTSINPGNSGGPLFSSAGELVGINGRGSFEKRGRVNSGAGYAISINQIKFFHDQIKAGRVVDHATLGATVTTDSDGTVVVNGILEASDVFRRGLRSGDELVTFAGRPVRTVNQFKNILGIYPKDWMLPIVFRHEGERREIHARLRGLHAKTELMPGPRPQQKPRQPMPKKDKDGNPEKTPDQPLPPRPDPHAEAAKQTIPEQWKDWFVEKAGFANYRFNQLEQDRVFAPLKGLGDFASTAGSWRLSGQSATGDKFELTLAAKGIGLEIRDAAFFQQLEDTDPADEPPGTGGFLIAAHQLRLLLQTGSKAFTECHYFGSEPLDGRGELVDVIVTTMGAIETRWFFSRASGLLLGLDSRLYEDAEPCLIRFENWNDFNGRRLPATWMVTSGEKEFATLKVATLEFTTKK
ncbi:MAG: serine protease [Planctomycetota bacterium]|nr:MAG: serine protease [Planctomycetota bacterium]GDY08424.1 serine protease [Planctomycetia bacterium]